MMTRHRPRWYLVRTKPRQEPRAEAQLRSWGIEILSPRIRETRAGRGARRVSAEGRLFPGYLFARFDIECVIKIRMTRGVKCVVGFGECATAIDDDVIDVVRERMDEDGCVKLEPPKPGDKVQIIDGPLSSLEGIFERQSAHERVVILLSSVLATARVEVPQTNIVKVTAPAAYASEASR